MSDHLDYTNKIGILDPEGLKPNPLNGEPYTQTYKDLAKVWSKLPGYAQAQTILKSIRDYPLTIAIMGTGTGKTVLVPKFALHYTGYKGKIGMTLPKKIITLSTAEFSAKTLDVVLGASVGYVYKGSNKSMYGPANKIVYMTDGVLIMQILKDPLLSEYEVIIVDEAHERKVQIDLILLSLKNLLISGKRPDLRVILMSATIDGAKYQDYFAGIKSSIIEVSGHPNHPIEVRFLTDPTKNYLETGLEIIRPLLSVPIKKDILFFVTTGKEAIDTCRVIRPSHPKVYCIEVYADMDEKLKLYAQERDKFMELGDYDQKLVIATNVAESSLTIDGLKYVVDSCYELYSYFDPNANAQILESKLISKDRALQRRGRVGRTEPGICYHLLTESEFKKLKPYSEPDILKQDITVDTLKIISLTENKYYTDGYEILSQMMDQPKQLYVNYTYDLLKLYKILDDKDHMEPKLASDILLFSSTPLNQSLFLIFAYQLFCAREASMILGMLEVIKNRITDLFYKQDTTCDSDCKKTQSKNYLRKIASKKSDHLTLLKIFEDYKLSPDRIAWAKKWGIILNKLKKADKNFNQYYRKIVNSARAPQIGGAQKIDLSKRLIEALKRSHKHLMASGMESTYARDKNEGQIQLASIVHLNYTKKELANKKFIFNELASINGNWEFSIVTLI
jgi:pre-mRNA-splicing factor ATP-dependent RNA helicase DHX15/PRP43